MSKKMLVNATLPEENRVAIVVDGVLAGLDIEVSGREPTKGNIYKAVVVRVETGLQAAFVDYGAERLGFLQIDEVNATTVKPDYNQGENGKSRPRINELLHRGQEILVQITKEERGTKGAALTTYLSLAGRYMVCMPGSQTRGVSRKVESDSERKQLKKAMDSLDLEEGIGYIVRTAGLGKTKEELQRDFTYLKHLYDEIRDKGNSAKPPALIYKESNLVIRSIRDSFTTDMDEVLIDDPDVFKEAKEFFNRIMPEYAGLVKLHQERRPIFSRYQIEDQIETINQNKVPLPSGGSIVIDPTEALVAIDVNSGKMTSEQGVEATAFKANLEAADEVGRQLRLRDLGGLIVIDFIDMRESKHNRKVEAQLKKSVELDKARISIGRISKFGLLEMSRQRIKAALAEGSSLSCPHCHGSGRIKSPESLAVGLIRRIQTGVAKGQIGRVSANLPLEVATYLLNNKREDLFDLERRYNLQIHIHGQPDYLTDQVEIDFQKREKEKQVQADYVEAGSVPLPPEAETDTPSETQEENGEAAEKPKRKRRRRRRKPASAAATAEAATAETSTGESEETTTDTQASDAAEPVQPESAEATAPQDAETAPTETTEKPKRRRRRRKPAAAAAEETTEEAIAAEGKESTVAAQAEKPTESVPQETVEVAVPQAAEETTPAADQKPKRRRSPRRKASPKTDEATTKGADEASETPAASSVTGQVAATAEPAAEQPEKPKRRRSPRKKPVEQPAPAEEKAQGDATEIREEVAPAEPGQAEEKPKRKRAPRKKSAAQPEPTQETPAAPQRESAPTPPAESTAPAETKPTPRRRTTRKKATEAPAEKPAETSVPADTPAAEPEEKPKRKRAPRKKPAPAVQAPEEPAKATPPPEQDEDKAAEKPKPRRRTTRKKAAPETETAQTSTEETVASATAPAEEKPKPRRRTTRRKPAEKNSEAPESSE